MLHVRKKQRHKHYQLDCKAICDLIIVIFKLRRHDKISVDIHIFLGQHRDRLLQI